MGKVTNLKILNGSTFSGQMSVEQYKYSEKIEEIKRKLLEEELFNILESQNADIVVKESIFIVKDKDGQLVWIDSGNSNAGMKHIIDRHSIDFYCKYGIKKSELPEFLRTLVEKGEITDSKKTQLGNGHFRIDKIYKYKNKYVVVGGLGDNGFLVTAYPYGKEKFNEKN